MSTTTKGGKIGEIWVWFWSFFGRALGFQISLSCFLDLSLIWEYLFINRSQNGLGDFLKGQRFFNELVMKSIQDTFAWLKSVEASYQRMTNSDETLSSRMGDNNVEPPKPGAERDVQVLTNVATLLEQWEDHTIESKQHAGVLEAYVGDLIPTYWRVRYVAHYWEGRAPTIWC